MSFDFHRPATVEEAAALLTGAADGKFLAGGMTLLPTIHQRLASPTDLIDLSAVPGLAGISEEDGVLVIGAMTRHADVAASPLVASLIPALVTLAGGIGDPQVRHRGTIGGSIANNDPAADYPAAVLGLGATIVTSRREIAADDFFVGMFETALAEDEVILSVRFPVPDKAAYMKMRSPASRYALAGVFVALFPDGARVAVTGAAPAVFRSTDLEEALTASFTPSALDRLSIDASDMLSDLSGDREYRANLVVVLARRAVSAALA
ncbi:FAD binding domain-containing protein [Acuticoccus kandeliae]|uniref:FAD binding domain-containing protein n=1 Tax=Acuticoccus kandeliae TaxID=2073160 RepID=UPI000D3ED900|nr:xanthine dehydrogenase family protein subunit M [Acuticoccus kandeliae]